MSMQQQIEKPRDKETAEKKPWFTEQQKTMIIKGGIGIAVLITIIGGIYFLAQKLPDIVVQVDVTIPEQPAPIVNIEPQAYNHRTADVDLLVVELPEIEIYQSLAIGPPEIPEDEVMALAKTIKGECFDGEIDDMRRVAWTVINRVDDPRFPNSVIEVVTAGKEHCPDGLGQFHGFRDSNVPTEDNIGISREVLGAYYSGDYSMRDEICDGKVYIYFSSRENETVNRYREG